MADQSLTSLSKLEATVSRADLGAAIARVLQSAQHPMTTIDIVKSLARDNVHVERSQVNSWLYRSPGVVKRSSESRPRWSWVEEPRSEQSASKKQQRASRTVQHTVTLPWSLLRNHLRRASKILLSVALDEKWNDDRLESILSLQDLLLRDADPSAAEVRAHPQFVELANWYCQQAALGSASVMHDTSATVVQQLQAFLLSQSAAQPTSQSATTRIAVLSTLIAIDLGHVHDCTKPLLDYLSGSASCGVQVMAFADAAFAGLGSTAQPVSAPGMYIWQNSSSTRDTTDIKMIRDVYRRLDACTAHCQVLIVSNDHLMVSLVEMINSERIHHAKLCKGWQDVRLHIE